MNHKDVTSRTKINDALLMSLDIEPKDYRLPVQNKLYLYVQKTGKKYWQIRYKKEDGKWSWHGLGVFPTINMKQAIQSANEFARQCEEGDFSFGKNTQSNKYKLRTLMDSWLDVSKVRWCKKYNTSVVNAVKKHVYPIFGERDFRSITSEEWLNFFLELVKNMRLSVKEKLYGLIKAAYDWAEIGYKFKGNPLLVINRFLPKYKRQPHKHIDISELDQFLKDIRAYPIQDISIGLELVLLLFPRHGEIREAKWEQFNLEKKYWIKPKEIMKNAKKHKVYLSHQAVALLKRLKAIQKPSVYLFPQCGAIHKPMSDDRFRTALEKMGYKERMTVHGVRYLASTTLNNAFSSKSQVIEAALSHKKGGVKGVYDKADHFDESAEIMQWWADYINNPNIKRKSKTKIRKAYGIYNTSRVHKTPIL
ncbi:site-specific integrase [Acinetobacter sp. BY484]|uniref:tyrosine-type recombinase/integrase n=1 Tax=Acinetobacter sp. BY484 TaxID=2820674 RepID=UPI001C220804|nr:site-specific integrase [Acinetobacter sp. BY484]